MTEIHIEVTGEELSYKRSGDLTKGMTCASVSFSFGPDWDDLHAIAVFRAGEVVVEKEIGNACEVVVPYCVMQQVGQQLEVAVEGRNVEKGIIYPTKWIQVGKIHDSAHVERKVPDSLEPERYNQIMRALGELTQFDTQNKIILLTAINELIAQAGKSRGSSNVFKVISGTTTFPEITEAHDEGKLCVAVEETPEKTYIMPLVYKSEDVAFFASYGCGGTYNMLHGFRTLTVTETDSGMEYEHGFISYDVASEITEDTGLEDIVPDYLIPTVNAVRNYFAYALEQAKESGEIVGEDGYTPVRGVDYWTDGDQEQINADNEAFIVSELAKRGQLKPEFANSVDDMTDTSKLYVLSETNEIWGYKKQQVIIPETNFNVFDKGEALINQRMNQSGAISTTTGAKGSFITNYIELTNWANATTPYNMNVNFVLQSLALAATTACFYDENKTFVGSIVCNTTGSAQNVTLRDTESVIDLKKNVQAEDGLVGFPNAKYIRIQLFKKVSQTALVASDLDDVVITLDANKTPSYVTEEYAWGSTGHAFVPADYEDRIVNLEEDVNRLTEDVINLQNNGGGSGTNVVVPTWWEDAVNECVAKIKALQVSRNCITFPFFSDNHQRNGYAGVLIARVMKECGIPYCFFGGDTIGSSYIADEAEMIAQDRAFDAAMSYIPDGRFCRAVGNHDGYWAVSSTEKYGYTKAQVYELFLREEGTAQNKTFGGEGTYYYVDDKPSKTRFVVLDTNPEPIGSTSEIIDSTQLSWLQNTALKFNESGWGVVIISHCPIANPYHANVTNAVEVIDIVKNYKNSTDSNKADIIGWFSGHIHRDRIYTNLYVNGDSNGYEGEADIALGFTQVTITSDRTDIAYGELVDGVLVPSPTKHPIDDSDLSHAIDFVTINKSARTVNLTRLGIGEDRSYSY